MNADHCVLTILTTTFNRAHTLRRLFQSLQDQTDRSFEWTVIDDGSTDGTQDLLFELKRLKMLPVHVFCQENSGKHAAINVGVRAARGEWIFIVDSDDALSSDAVATVLQACTNPLSRTGFCFRRGYFMAISLGEVSNRTSRFASIPQRPAEFFVETSPTCSGAKLCSDTLSP